MSPKLREAIMRYYQEAVDVLNHVPLTHPEERRLQKLAIRPTLSAILQGIERAVSLQGGPG